MCGLNILGGVVWGGGVLILKKKLNLDYNYYLFILFFGEKKELIFYILRIINS